MNFDKKFDKYEENAHIQKIVAMELIGLVPKKNITLFLRLVLGLVF
ncbi:hypothetical protein [Psychrilyobacter sp.]